MSSFEIAHLDHVAIRVKDIEASAKWYNQVLGLKKYRLEKWGDYPIFMLSGHTGIAIFPANENDPIHNPDSKNTKIDHFAFRVTNENFARAKTAYDQLGLHYTFQDHHYFHSIYTKDPDGHTVELTTIVVKEEDFYQ
jgi:catechol 2,3-dioxygenase-like lactoylglutathione lyase family enzyme